jgi:uncharacterized protein (DUF305 family)
MHRKNQRMTALQVCRASAVLLVVAVAAGLASPGLAYAQDSDPKAAAGAQSARLSNSEIEALYRARQDSARMRFTEADVAFVSGMISHHAQALVMSDLAPARGASPTVQTLAARIINAQTDEIALMQRWLEDRGQPVPQVKIDGLDLTISMSAPAGSEGMAHAAGADHDAHMPADDHADAAHAADAHHMPGMLTREQLEELAAAYGPDFDRLFLTYMIGHHSGAVTMVDELFAVDGAGQDRAVFKLASDVQVDQITEIERMKQMLRTMAVPTESDSGR